MTLENLANLGEIIGAIAVVVSLVYLATQLRQANAIAKANAYRDFHQDVNSVLNQITTNPELHDIWRKGLYHREDLEPAEKDRLGMILFQLFSAINGGFQSSWLDASISDYVRIITDLQLGFPHVRDWWVRQRELHPGPFRDYVDGRLQVVQNELRDEQ